MRVAFIFCRQVVTVITDSSRKQEPRQCVKFAKGGLLVRLTDIRRTHRGKKTNPKTPTTPEWISFSFFLKKFYLFLFIFWVSDVINVICISYVGVKQKAEMSHFHVHKGHEPPFKTCFKRPHPRLLLFSPNLHQWHLCRWWLVGNKTHNNGRAALCPDDKSDRRKRHALVCRHLIPWLLYMLIHLIGELHVFTLMIPHYWWFSWNYVNALPLWYPTGQPSHTIPLTLCTVKAI